MGDEDERSEAEVLAWRCDRALREAPEIAMHVRSLIVPGNGQGERGEEDPRERAPLRVTPTDAADNLFANLLLWLDYWCEELGQATPLPASVAWSNYREVQGFRAGTSVEDASRLVGKVTAALRSMAEGIALHGQGGVYHVEIVRLIGELRGQFPLEQRKVRPAHARPCPNCKEAEVRADWWGVDDTDVEVKCGACGWKSDADYKALMTWLVPVKGERVLEPFDPGNPFHEGLRASVRSSPDSGSDQ